MSDNIINKYLATSHLLKEKEYWKKKFEGEIIKTGIFPFSYKQNTTKPLDHIENIYRKIDENTYTKLIKICNNSDIGLYIVLHSVLAIILNRYTSNEDIIIGTSIEKQDSDSDFINTVLPIRVKINQNVTFKELLLEVKNAFLEANTHQNYPIESLVNDLNLEFSLSNFPLFDVTIILDNFQEKKYITDIKTNIGFLFVRNANALELTIGYNSMNYDIEFINNLAQHYENVLSTVINNINIKLSEIELLSKIEKDQILNEFNNTHEFFPKEKLLHELFEEQVVKSPDKIAVCFNEVQLSYKELNERSNQFARYLIEKGVQPNEVVGLILDLSVELIIAILGILKAGAAFMPIDIAYPEDRIIYMLKNSGSRFVLIKNTFTGIIKDSFECIFINDSYINSSKKGNIIEKKSSSVAYVIYTSGTAGHPKGVIIEHKSIVNQIFCFNKRYYSKPLNHILIAPYTFDPSIQHIFSPLSYGAKLYIVPNRVREDAKLLIQYLISRSIDIIDAVPSQMNILLDYIDKPTRNFKHILLAGEAFTIELYNKIKKSARVDNILNVYGPTEATINSTIFSLTTSFHGLIIPIGTPLTNYRILILDENMNLLPIGVPGEIYILGEGLARGYLNNPELTNKCFVLNPYNQREIMYKSGDYGRYLPDGNIEFIGRIDNQVKIRGQRVELEEVENSILKIDEIKEVAVIVNEKKEGDKSLHAFFVSEKDVEVSYIRKCLAELVPNYMIPSSFTKIDKLPKTSHDKIDKKKLKVIERMFLRDAEYVPPRNDKEEKMVDIWQRELAIDKVGIKDDFFVLGGDSLKSIKLIVKINETFNANLTIVDLYESTTIENLAEKIQDTVSINKDEKYNGIIQELDELKQSIIQNLN